MSKRSTSATTVVSLHESVEQLIHTVLDKRWAPPQSVVPALDRILQHNQANPTARIGIRRIRGWLMDQGVQVGRDALNRWLQDREVLS